MTPSKTPTASEDGPPTLRTRHSPPQPLINVRLDTSHSENVTKTGDPTIDTGRQVLKQHLLNEVAWLKRKMDSLKSEAAKQRVAEKQQDILAAIGVLHVMDDYCWQNWEIFQRNAPFGFSYQFAGYNGRSAREMIDTWLQKEKKEEVRGKEALSSRTKHW
ncbi:hypothetical protein F5Y17DRAFT_205509 [Xylariaceae sp. FL0594]|nr:hypothetical protein F5Y17DRAFT_205509 [Xylariaceae sp. FL0594]